MIKNFILEQTDVPLLSKALDVYAMRQKAIASNIANVNTSGYRRKEIRFEEQLQAQLNKHLPGRRSEAKHIPLGSLRIREINPEYETDSSRELESGVSNVDIDTEIVEQVKNEIRFMYASRLLSGKLAALRASIKGRYDR